ncbi:MAG: hypothetical protein QOJ29_1180 [Thermoleophilaceae bacterium]|nr:hypothetical protein [Thermoleophilaceae bacterium]
MNEQTGVIARFSVAHDSVQQAAHMLGLTHRVRVYVRRYEWLGGRYIALVDGEHRIGVASDLSAREASRALWHELTHARQVEQLGGAEEFSTRWWREMSELGLTRVEAALADSRRYRSAPLEAEAKVGERNHRRLSLARPVRRRRLWPERKQGRLRP